MLAVNRSYGKSDYIPCITWGRTARYAAGLKTGDKVQLVGRFQSRNYQKQLPDGTVITKVAYEVSVSRLNALREEITPSYDLQQEIPKEFHSIPMRYPVQSQLSGVRE